MIHIVDQRVYGVLFPKKTAEKKETPLCVIINMYAYLCMFPCIQTYKYTCLCVKLYFPRSDITIIVLGMSTAVSMMPTCSAECLTHTRNITD